MTKLMLTLAATVAAAGGFAILPAPSAAQQAAGEVVVFGNDPCPRASDSTVYVCTRRPEQERDRLPKNQQLQGTRQERRSWANKARALNSVGKTGIGSCSAVGPGGSTGCLVEEIKQAKRENQEAADQATAPEE